jgi:ABC-type polysaccharide/polyol phosphate export permease
MSSEARATVSPRTPRALEALLALTRGAIRQEQDFTVTGVLRWVLEPLSFMLVYFVLVAAVLNSPQKHYLLFLLCALLPFRFFAGVVGASMAVIQVTGSILTNRAFPRVVLPLTVLGTEGVPFLLSLGLLAPLMALYRVAPTVQLLWVPVVVVVLGVLSAGTAYVGAVLGLYFPDLRGLTLNFVRVSFFISTGLVVAEQVRGPQLKGLVAANPLSGIFDSLRAAVIDGRAPSPYELLYPLGFGLVVLTLGLALYRWREPHLAKEV